MDLVRLCRGNKVANGIFVIGELETIVACNIRKMLQLLLYLK